MTGNEKYHVREVSGEARETEDDCLTTLESRVLSRGDAQHARCLHKKRWCSLTRLIIVGIE